MMENNSENHNKNHNKNHSEIERKKGTEMSMEGLVETENGQFSTIQEALDDLECHPDTVRRILVHPGVYEEQVTVRVPGVTICGESRETTEQTVITYALGARTILEDGKKRGTFRTYTMFVDTPDVTLENLTIENGAGPGTEVGQAIALYADGDRLCVRGCRLLGWQDTLFTAPLPPKEIEKDGFIGPKQFAPRTKTRQYYEDCYIEGEVDFIFGGAMAWFENCTLFSKNVDREIKGYVTAPSTPEGQRFGYVMSHCRFESNCPQETVYLGRPWREWAKVVLLNCEIGAHICAEGWNDWGKELAHETSFFAEYGCQGEGADLSNRPDWTHRLTKAQAEEYTVAKMFE